VRAADAEHLQAVRACSNDLVLGGALGDAERLASTLEQAAAEVLPLPRAWPRHPTKTRRCSWRLSRQRPG
jgi:hypothetical protein